MEFIPQSDEPSPSPWATAAVALCGVCAFLGLYCTQPLLPLLTTLFHASKTSVGWTVSAATLGVALSAPIFGAFAERLPRKRVIVASVIGVAVPTLLAATSTSLAQLVFWRFLQGIAVPGIIAVVITYIGEEWPPKRVALVMSFYVSGTALGGFIGRVSSGILADWFGWRMSFLVLGAAALVGAGAVAAWLPRSCHRPSPSAVSGAQPRPIFQAQALFRRRRLVATFAVGFNVLFSLVGVFTWITFHLAAAPFLLSTAALSSLFFVYLVGLVVTPAAGFLITRVGLRAGIMRRHCLFNGRRSAHPGSLAVRGYPGTFPGLHRRLHLPDRLAKPLARGRAPGGARHRRRALSHLLLSRRHRRWSRSWIFLDAGQMASLRRLHHRHTGRGADHCIGGMANAKDRVELIRKLRRDCSAGLLTGCTGGVLAARRILWARRPTGQPTRRSALLIFG